MTSDSFERAAALLAEARLTGQRLTHLPESSRPPDEAAAYAVQDRLHAMLDAAGHGPVAGRKIGCTTEVMQRYLGIDSPCAGGLAAPTITHGHGLLHHGDFLRVGVECEIAVRLDADLPHGKTAHSRESVTGAVGACMAAIEIVDDRYVDYTRLDTPTLIADDFFNAGAVLGPPVEDWRGLDLAGLKGRMTINGDEAGTGRGADILGHPLEALAWLANAQNARMRSLRSGEIVLLGSLVQTRWLDAGDQVEIDIDGLGRASAHFA